MHCPTGVRMLDDARPDRSTWRRSPDSVPTTSSFLHEHGALPVNHFSRHLARVGLVAAFCWCAFSVPACLAQDIPEPSEDISIGKRYIIHSTTLGEDRQVFVHLPKGYARGDRRYPVIYVLDGESHFALASSVVDFLSTNNRVPAMIVVSIPNTHRDRDLTPPGSDPERKNGPGRSRPVTTEGAENFLTFLADELRPWVDSHLRTEDFRILSGHSLGGIFSWYTLVSRPDAFQAHITISPSLHLDQGRWAAPSTTDAARKLAHMSGRHFMYLTWGNHEPKLAPKVQELVSWLQVNPPTALQWTHRYYPDETHGTNPHPSLYDGLEWLFADWRMPGQEGYWRAPPPAGQDFSLAQVQAHYAALSEKYGYAVTPSSESMQRVAYHLLARKQYDEAIALLERNERNHPDDFGSSSALADAFEHAGRWSEAANAYERALELAVEEGPPYTDQADRFRAAAGKNRDMARRRP